MPASIRVQDFLGKVWANILLPPSLYQFSKGEGVHCSIWHTGNELMK
jgi:hypothetical protein